MQEKTSSGRSRIFFLIFLVIIILSIAGIISMKEKLAREICKTTWAPLSIKKFTKLMVPQDAIIIFVHGTFGSTMSLLDLPTVNNDKVQDSKYKLIIDMLRNNPIFWRDQAVLERGLILVDGHKAPQNSAQQLSGALPILRAFVEIDRAIGKNRNIKTYTFGWSGLLSQQRRRKEAIRFYNQICEEIVRLEQAEGIFEPEIEIIAHSHGGNVALNLAGIYHTLNNNMDSLVDEKIPTKKEFEAELFRLREKTDPERFIDGQHRFDYLPTKKDLKIDKLIMMGTPVQPKTYALAASPMFGQVFNIYSDEDAVQKMDFVSCCSDTESRKFLIDERLHKGNVFQVKISICSDQVLKGAKFQDKKTSAANLSWWQVFMGMKDISRNSWDPTHKELWFLVDSMSTDEPEVLKPLPVAVFVPLIVEAINESKLRAQELDVDLSIQGNKLLAFIAEHKTGNFAVVKSISKALVRELAQNIRPNISTEQDALAMKAFIQKLMDSWKQMQESH